MLSTITNKSYPWLVFLFSKILIFTIFLTSFSRLWTSMFIVLSFTKDLKMQFIHEMSKKRPLLANCWIELSNRKYYSGFICNFLKYYRCLNKIENYLPTVKTRDIGRNNVADLVVTSPLESSTLKIIGRQLTLPTNNYSYPSIYISVVMDLFQERLANTCKYRPILYSAL